MYYFVNKKHTVRFPHVLCYFISLYLKVLTFAIRLKSANYKSHWHILVFYDQWKIMSDLNMSHRKMSDFVLFLWLRFTLVLKLRNFDFESHWNTLIYLDKKGVRFEYIHIYIYIHWIYSKCLILFHFHCLGTL